MLENDKVGADKTHVANESELVIAVGKRTDIPEVPTEPVEFIEIGQVRINSFQVEGSHQSQKRYGHFLPSINKPESDEPVIIEASSIDTIVGIMSAVISAGSLGVAVKGMRGKPPGSGGEEDGGTPEELRLRAGEFNVIVKYIRSKENILNTITFEPHETK